MKNIFINKTVLRFAKNFSWLFLVNGLGYVFSFISFPILIGKYGLKEVGVIFTVQALVMLLASVANYSFVYYIPTVSKRVSEDKVFIIKLWNMAIQIRTLFSLFLALLFSLMVYWFFREYLFICLLSLPLLLPKIVNPTLFCNALEANDFVFKIGFYSKLLFLILIYLSHNSNLVNLFLALSELIVILFYLKKINPKFLQFYWVPLYELKAFLSQTFNLFMMNFFIILKPNAVLPCVSYLFGFEFGALFALAQKVINVIKGISGTVFTSFFPIYNKGEFDFSLLSVRNAIAIFSVILIGVIGLWYLSPTIIYYLNSFQDNALAAKTLQILILAVPIFFIMIPLFSYLLQHNKWYAILSFTIIQLLVLIVAWNFLIGQNIIGVAKSILISEYTLFFCYLILVVKLKYLVPTSSKKSN